jgi:hypothetical protein
VSRFVDEDSSFDEQADIENKKSAASEDLMRVIFEFIAVSVMVMRTILNIRGKKI